MDIPHNVTALHNDHPLMLAKRRIANDSFLKLLVLTIIKVVGTKIPKKKSFSIELKEGFGLTFSSPLTRKYIIAIGLTYYHKSIIKCS